MRAARVFTRVINKSHWGVISNVVAHLDLSLRSENATTSVPVASPEVVVDVLGVGLDAEGDWDL